MRRIFGLGCWLFAAAASAGVVLTFDENVVPTNPENGFSSFTFGGFVGGAVTDGPTSLVIDSLSFGGIGVDYLQRDFDVSLATGEIRLRVLPGNAAVSVNAIMVESDDDTSGSLTGEQYGVGFGLGGLTPADGFVTLSAPLTSVFSAGGAFGRGPGDGVFNPGLYQIQLQSPFGATDRLHVEVDYFRITAIPEPGAFLFGAALTVGCGVWRWRRSV